MGIFGVVLFRFGGSLYGIAYYRCGGDFFPVPFLFGDYIAYVYHVSVEPGKTEFGNGIGCSGVLDFLGRGNRFAFDWNRKYPVFHKYNHDRVLRVDSCLHATGNEDGESMRKGNRLFELFFQFLG